jgi:hypothetical protein
VSLRPLPPIDVPWVMKPLESAQTKVERVGPGQTRYSIRHDVLRGVTPKMLVWWLNNMAGEVEIGGRMIARYRAWHPTDHVALTYVRPAIDGRRFGTGAQVRIQELFGADPKNAIDVVSTIERLDESGFVHGEWVLGINLARMEYRFTAVDGGTLYENSLTTGSDRPWAKALNFVAQSLLFDEAKGRAWLRHNVEEVGNLEHFLPDLYRSRS